MRLIHADYTAIPLPDHSVDYAYAIESACHASGPDKAAFVRELSMSPRAGPRPDYSPRAHSGRSWTSPASALSMVSRMRSRSRGRWPLSGR